MLVTAPSGQIEYRRRPASRRVLVFVVVFIASAGASLNYVYKQPAEYRAASRVQISPARSVGEADQTSPPTLQEHPAAFLTEVQALTSRPVVESALDRLRRETTLPDLGPDPVAGAQELLHAEPVEHTEMVELSAEGIQRGLLSRLVNAVADAYRDRSANQFKERTSNNYDEVRDELEKLHQQAVTRRAAVEAFRAANNIVSLERDENSVLANVQNLGSSYSSSVETLAKAEGRLRALKNATGSGAALVVGKDDPTLAALEQQLATLRDQLTELQRRFTPAYIALDANATALERRITGLERQIATQRTASQNSAIAAAQAEFETAQAQVNSLRTELSDNQKKAQEFASRMSRLKTMQEDLDHLESIERFTADRLTKMQATERESAPKVEILELAAPNPTPIGPNYATNAAVAVAGSFGLGIFAVWFIGFLGAPGTRQFTTPPAIPLEPWHAPALPRFSDQALHSANERSAVQLLTHQTSVREIDENEIVALATSASEPVALACAGLLSGISPSELLTLNWDDVNLDTGEIYIHNDSTRVIPLEEPLLTVLKQQSEAADRSATVLHDARGDPWTADELAHGLLCAAFDAALPRPDEITPAALRHTYIAWLFAQGIRAADVAEVAGNIPHEDLVTYMHFAASASRMPLSAIDRVHPAIRKLPARPS